MKFRSGTFLPQRVDLRK